MDGMKKLDDKKALESIKSEVDKVKGLCQCAYEHKFAVGYLEKCGSVSIKASVITTIAFFIMYNLFIN